MTLPRVRTLDAVVLAAVALLGLKTLGLLSVDSGRGSSPRTVEAAPEGGRGFAAVLAHARTNYEPGDPLTTGSVGGGHALEPAPAAAAEPAPAATPLPEPAPAPSPAERALLERLGQRRDELQQRGREIEMREKLMEEGERRLDARLDDIKALEEKGAAGAAARKGDGEAAGLKNLVIMYEAMKPKEAARVFDRLPQDVLVPVVTGMNPRKMSEILAAMSPDSAQKLTVALARRAGGKGDDKAPGPGTLPAGELPAIEPVRR